MHVRSVTFRIVRPLPGSACIRSLPRTGFGGLDRSHVKCRRRSPYGAHREGKKERKAHFSELRGTGPKVHSKTLMIEDLGGFFGQAAAH